MGLSIIETNLKHTSNQKTKKLTFKMHGFEPHNMFSMVNTMINDPEFKKLAQNFEDHMKNTMEEMKKAQTNESKKTTENSSSSSSPKTAEKWGAYQGVDFEFLSVGIDNY